MKIAYQRQGSAPPVLLVHGVVGFSLGGAVALASVLDFPECVEKLFADRLDEIQVPTLIVTGEHDTAATPRMAHLMGERIRDSQVHVLPRLRHSLLIEALL